MKYLSPASWDWLVAKAQRHQRRQHPCRRDRHEQNAAIGLVTSATASLMAGSRLVM